eukprot:627416_1
MDVHHHLIIKYTKQTSFQKQCFSSLPLSHRIPIYPHKSQNSSSKTSDNYHPQQLVTILCWNTGLSSLHLILVKINRFFSFSFPPLLLGVPPFDAFSAASSAFCGSFDVPSPFAASSAFVTCLLLVFF